MFSCSFYMLLSSFLLLSRAFGNLNLSCAPSLFRSLYLSPSRYSVIVFVSFSPTIFLSLSLSRTRSLVYSFPGCVVLPLSFFCSGLAQSLSRLCFVDLGTPGYNSIESTIAQVSCLVVSRSSLSRFYRVSHKQQNTLQEQKATSIKQKTTEYIKHFKQQYSYAKKKVLCFS